MQTSLWLFSVFTVSPHTGCYQNLLNFNHKINFACLQTHGVFTKESMTNSPLNSTKKVTTRCHRMNNTLQLILHALKTMTYCGLQVQNCQSSMLQFWRLLTANGTTFITSAHSIITLINIYLLNQWVSYLQCSLQAVQQLQFQSSAAKLNGNH